MTNPTDPIRITMPTIGTSGAEMGSISFAEIERKLIAREQVFIRNKRPQYWAIIQYKDSNGNIERPFNIPATSLPFDITAYVGPDNLANSESFRTFFSKGLLEYVPIEVAAKELSDPETLQALRKALNDSNNTANAREVEAKRYRESLEDDSTKNAQNNTPYLNPTNQVPVQQTQGQSPSSATTIATKFAALEARAKSGKMPAEDILQDLRGMLGELTRQQLDHVISSAFFPQEVRNWATERIKHRG